MRFSLMDEPSLGLAPQPVIRTFGVVDRMRAAGTTIQGKITKML